MGHSQAVRLLLVPGDGSFLQKVDLPHCRLKNKIQEKSQFLAGKSIFNLSLYLQLC